MALRFCYHWLSPSIMWSFCSFMYSLVHLFNLFVHRMTYKIVNRLGRNFWVSFMLSLLWNDSVLSPKSSGKGYPQRGNIYVCLPVVMKSLFHGTGSVPTESGICRCWPDCLELFARGHAWSGCFWGQLQAVTEGVFIFAVLVCFSALEVFYENALYKFTFDIDIDYGPNCLSPFGP